MVNIKTTWLLLIALMFFGTDVTPAQKRQKKKPAPKAKTEVRFEGPARFETDDRETMPEIKDLAYVVNIDENSNITVRVQKSEDVEFISNTADPAPLGKFFGSAKDKTFSPVIIVQLGTPAYWGDTLDVLRKIRDTSPLKMKAEIEPGSYVFIPTPWPAGVPRSNPLHLVVKLDKNSKLFLNSEGAGSLDDLTELQNFLKRIFSARAVNGVFRVGSNEIESTVYFEADAGAKFEDVREVIRAIRTSGSTLVGLDLFPVKAMTITMDGPHIQLR